MSLLAYSHADRKNVLALGGGVVLTLGARDGRYVHCGVDSHLVSGLDLSQLRRVFQDLLEPHVSWVREVEDENPGCCITGQVSLRAFDSYATHAGNLPGGSMIGASKPDWNVAWFPQI